MAGERRQGASRKGTGATRLFSAGQGSEPLCIRMERLKTPIGEMLIGTDGGGHLRAVDWVDCESRMQRLLRLHYGGRGFRIECGPALSEAAAALARYFEGELTAIDGLAVETGGTDFQREVWRALRKIPCGTTTTYAELARQIGRPAAVRAVGAANGANPVGVVVPCHRVIGSDGSLTGYAGGTARKMWLLRHEGGKDGGPGGAAARVVIARGGC